MEDELLPVDDLMDVLSGEASSDSERDDFPTHRYICAGCNKDDFVSAQSIDRSCPNINRRRTRTTSKKQNSFS